VTYYVINLSEVFNPDLKLINNYTLVQRSNTTPRPQAVLDL